MQRPIVESMLQPMVVAIREGSITRNLIRQSATMQTFITLTTPIPSGNEVSMLVYPANGNTGLPAGAPSVTNNVFQVITFTLTADMLYVAREGNNYFSGFIANLVGPAINEAIDEDLSNPNLGWGTASASLSAQFSEPYQVIDVGFLQVANRIANGNFESPTLPAQWMSGNAVLSIVNNQLNVVTSATSHNARYEQTQEAGEYRFEIDAISTTQAEIKYSAFNFTTSTEYIAPTAYPIGHLSFDVVHTGGILATYPLRDSGSTGTSVFDNASLKRLLRNA